MAKKDLKRGIFITFEGPEGCGKSTHARLLCNLLREHSYDYLLTREPGGTKAGEEIRRLLLHSDGVEISSMTELFLFEAARSQIVEELITPNLAKRRIVVCDRFSDATVCYQGYAGGLDVKVIAALNSMATGGLKPDLTILLDVEAGTGLGRAKRKGSDRMERKELAYHSRVRSGYLKLAKRYPSRIKLIRVADDIEDTQECVRREVERVIQRYRRTG